MVLRGSHIKQHSLKTSKSDQARKSSFLRALCPDSVMLRQRYAPTALCPDSVMPRQRYAPTALCSDSVMPSVMPSQRYALLALCLAGVMPFCARKIYLNTLYLGCFCMKYALFRQFLHETRRFCSKSDIQQKTKKTKKQTKRGSGLDWFTTARTNKTTDFQQVLETASLKVFP